MPAAIELGDLTVLREQEGGGSVPVVHALSLSIAPRARVALVGRNGAGKTSLLLALVGALPFSGEARIADLPVEKSTLAQVRRKVGFVFADPADQLFCASVREEVAFGPLQLGSSADEIDRRVERSLAAVGLHGTEPRAPSTLSLGMQRRLALAAALALEPVVVLIDEPTAALDPVARRELVRLLGELDATLVFATHDLDAALDLDVHAVVLDAGRKVAEGPARELLVDEELLEGAGLALPLSVAALRRR